MSWTSAPNADSKSLQGAQDALILARGTFLKGLECDDEITTSQATGVAVDPESGALVLYINPQTSLAAALAPSVGNWRDAWLLILAHESGHLRLNSICQASGDDPNDPNAQLKAIGIDQTAYSPSSIADFQKETAIEAFCDVCAGLAAVELLGSGWEEAVKALRDYRARGSASLSFFKGDEYATSPALDELIKRNGKIEPAQAARLAFDASLRKNSSLRKVAVATASRIPEIKKTLRDRLQRWRKACAADRPGSPPAPPSAP